MTDDFHQFELEGWQRVADRYQATWSGLTRPFIPHLLQAVSVTSDIRLLDVACGPGYVAEAASALGASVIGVDFCSRMVRLARERNPQIEFREGDAQAVDFADGSFDAVAMNFGVLHLSRPEDAFAEAHRILRPGGRFGFTVWAAPDLSPGAGIIEEAINAHADMDVYVPEGPDFLGYGNPERCRTVLGSAGFDPGSLVFHSVTLDWQVPSASFLFEAELNAGVRTAAILRGQEPPVLAAIRDRLEQAMRPYAKGDGFSLPYTAHVVAVARP